MAAPFTSLFPLASNLNGEDQDGGALALTGVDPIRYDSGLWMEAATKNYVLNPIAAATTNQWTPVSATVTRVTSLPGPLPGWLASLVTTGVLVEATAATSGTKLVMGTNTLDGAGDHHTVWYVWLPAAYSGAQLQVTSQNFVGATQTATSLNMSIRDAWQMVTHEVAIVGSDLVGQPSLNATQALTIGDQFYVTAVGIQTGSPSSPAVGSFGTGWAWTSTANASPSTRAASSASVTIAEPASIAAWYTETPGGSKTFAYIEPHGTIGTYGSVAWAGGTLTISTTRSLTIGPLATFDRALDAGEQSYLGGTQSWSIGMLTTPSAPAPRTFDIRNNALLRR